MMIVPNPNGFVLMLFNLNVVVRIEGAKNETHGI